MISLTGTFLALPAIIANIIVTITYITRFGKLKMDASAVKQSSVEDLKELGLSRRDDILVFKSFLFFDHSEKQGDRIQREEKKAACKIFKQRKLSQEKQK